MEAEWKPEELKEALDGANAFVRHLLFELSRKEAQVRSELKSPNTAFALAMKLSKFRGKEALFVREEREGQAFVSLAPKYRASIEMLVSDARTMPARKKREVVRPKGSARELVQSGKGPSRLELPPGVGVEYCRKLVGFLNEHAGRGKFHIILDSERSFLEA